MAKYYITGVFKNSKNVITHIMMHESAPNNEFLVGKKTSESDAIRMHKNGDSFFTLVWENGPTGFGWYQGEEVRPITEGNNLYLRTIANEEVNDNLDNIINLNGIADEGPED